MSGAGIPPSGGPPPGDGGGGGGDGGGGRRRRRRGRGGRGGGGGERGPEQQGQQQQQRPPQQQQQQQRPQQQQGQQQQRPPQDRGPRTDDRGPRADDRGPRADDRGARRDDRGPRRDDRGPRRDDRGPRRDDRGPRRDERPREQPRPFASQRAEPPASSTVERPALAAPPPSLAPLAHPSADIDAGWGAEPAADATTDETPSPERARAVEAEIQRTPTPPPVPEPRDPDGEDVFAGDEQPVPPGAIANVAGVKFRNAGTIYEFDSGDVSYARGERVVVESDRGPLVATVAIGSRRLPVLDPLRRIMRRATAVDESGKDKNAAKEREAYLFCKQRIRDRNLPMKLVRVEYPLSGGKVLFYFASEERIDFRDLVKDLGVARARAHRDAPDRRARRSQDGRRHRLVRPRALLLDVAARRSCRSRSRWPRIRASCSTRRRCRGSAGGSSAASSTSTTCYKEMRKGLPKVGKRVNTPAGDRQGRRARRAAPESARLVRRGRLRDLPARRDRCSRAAAAMGKGGRLPRVPPDEET